MIIDINMLWLPADLFTDKSLLDSFIHMIPRAYDYYARLDTIPGTQKLQINIEKPEGYPVLNYSDLHCDLEKRLAVMDEGKVDKAILKLACGEEWIDLETAKKFNDIAAKAVRKYPDRFLALAFVPPWGNAGCLYEVERCIKELGCCGVQMAAHYRTQYLDMEEFRPYFQKLNRLDVPICVNHTPLPVDYGNMYQYTPLRRGIGRLMDQLTSVGRVLHSGMLDEFPNLKFIFSFLGGCFFGFTDFMLPKNEPAVKGEVPHGPDPAQVDKVRGYLKGNMYFDMSQATSWSKAHLEFAIKILGSDHVLYSSSYPARIEPCVKGAEFVSNLDISEKDKRLILGENAQKLFKI